MNELDLNDPATLNAVLSKSVTDVPRDFKNDEEVVEAQAKEKLKPLERIKANVAAKTASATFTLKLSASQLATVQRGAIESGFGEDWKGYLTQEIDSRIFQGPIGSPRISKPSWATQNVTGPINW